MKKLTLFFILIIFISPISYSQFKLEAEVTGLRNNKGNVMIQLFDSTEKVLVSQMNTIKDNKSVFLFEVNEGKYALRYYHDENINGEMEINMLGKPTEGYGFSNNVTGKFGPPPFKKWLFEVKGDKKITLNPVY
jgi:uncharacterized protein (DUF2141 family)